MRIFQLALCRTANDLRGITALEYGLIAAVMAALVITAVTTLGDRIDTAYTSIGTLIMTTTVGM